MAVNKFILKHKTEDPRLNEVLETIRDKINYMIDEIPWETVAVDYVRLVDTNATHYLQMFWGEDDLANRTLELNVNAANRVISLTGNLVVEATSTINSDLTTDANWATSGTIAAEGRDLARLAFMYMGE